MKRDNTGEASLWLNLAEAPAEYSSKLKTVHQQLTSPLPVAGFSNGVTDSLIDAPPSWLKLPRRTVELQQAELTPIERVLKRTIDLGLALTALVLVIPLMAATGIAIKLDSPGPVIFRQRRFGFNSKIFAILKFRTMKVLEDGPTITQACPNDPRVTCVGRLLRRASIDEIPQLINVIKGEMSLVGPRPHALVHDYKYEALVSDYLLRRRVKPGLTGWAQINGLRGETKQLDQMVRRVELDLWYIKHWSIRLDLYIIIRTCFEIVRIRAY
jgi:putative colanic acid biosynthesis UDP-glucose lipid carrier transferase